MANRYWVGGTANWNTSTANWSATSGGPGGASAPTAADSVFFDQAGTYTVTTSGTLACLDITVSAGTYTFTGVATLAISGSMSLIAGTVYSSSSNMTFNATSPVTITTNGTTINVPTLNFSGVGGTFTLGSALTVPQSSTLTLSNGTLALNDFTVSCGIFSSTASTARSITFGTGNIVLTSTTAATTVLNMATATNFTYTGTGGFTADASVARTYVFGTVGGTSTNAPNLTLTGSGTEIQTFTTGSRFNKLDFGTTVYSVPSTSLSINSLTLSTSGSFTNLTVTMIGTGTITSNGNTTLGSVTINGAGITTTLNDSLTVGNTKTVTLTAGTLNLNGFDLTTGIFSSNNSNTRSIVFGSNNIILIAANPSTTVLDMATITGFTYTGAGGFSTPGAQTYTFTVGSTAGGTASNAPNLIFTGSAAATLTFTTNSWFKTLNFGTTSPTVGTAATLNLVNLTLSSGGTFTNLSATMRDTGTITPNGKAIAALTINNGAGTTTLAAALTCTTYTQTAGTIDFATFNLTCSSTATYTAGTLNNIGTISCTTWTCGGTFTLTQGTLIPSSSFVVTGGFNYNGGTLSLVGAFTLTSGTVTLSKALTVTGNYTLTAGTLTLNGFDLTTNIFNSTGSGVRSIAFGTNNIVLVSTTPNINVLNMATTTNFTCTGTGGFTADASVARIYTFGSTTAGGTEPNLTFTGSGTAVQTLTTSSWFKKLDFGTTAFNPGTTALSLNSLTLSSGGTYTGLSATMFREGTITPNGKTIAALTINVTVSATPTTTLAGALSCTTYTHTAGTFDFATFNLTCSGAVSYSGATSALSNIGTISCTTFTVTTGGTLTLTSGTITPSTSFIVSGTGTFNYNGGTLSPVATFTHTAGTVSFGKAYALTATGTYTLTAGTLTLNGFDLTTGIFASTNSNVRSIAFGTNNIILSTTTAAATNLSMANATNFTWSGTGGFTTAMSVTRTFTFGTTGGTATNAPNLSITSGASIPTFTDGSWFDVLNFTGTTCTPAMSAVGIGIYVDTLTLATGGTYTGLIPVFTRTQTWTSQFSKQLGGIGVGATGVTLTLDNTQTYTATAQFILTAGTLDLGGYNLTIGTFSSNNSNTRSISFGTNNIILSTTTGLATNLSMATATGFTYTGTGGFTAAADITRTFTFGTTGGSSTNAPNLSLTGSGTAVLTFTTGSWFNTLNFGTTAFNPGTTALSVNSLTLSSGGTFTGVTINTIGTGTITPNGKTIAALTINCPAGTTTLAGAVAVATTAITTLTAGTLDLAGFTLTTGAFNASGTTARSIAFGSGSITLAASAPAQIVLSIANATNFTYTGTGGFTAAASVTRTFTFGTTGGSSTNAPNLTITGSFGTSVQTFTSGSWFNTLDFGTSAFTVPTTSLNVSTLTLSAGSTYTNFTPIFTRTQTWTMQSSRQLAGIGVNGVGVTLTLDGTQTYTATSQCILTSGTLDLGGYNLTIGTFSSNNSNTRSIVFGTNNIILATTTAASTNLSMATATGFSYTGTGGFTAAADITRTFTFGTTAGGSSTTAPNLTLTGSGTAVATITSGGYFNKLDFGTTSFILAASTLFVNSITLSNGSFLALNVLTMGTGTITTNGKYISSLEVNCPGGTTTLAGAVTTDTASTFTLTAGTLDLAGYTLTTGLLSSSNTNTRSISFGTGTITIVHTTAAQTVLSMANATNFTCTGTGGFSSSAAVTRTFTFGTTGGSATNSPNLALAGSGTAVQTFTTGSWFNKLDFGTTVFTVPATTLNLEGLTLASGGTFTNLSVNFVGTGTFNPLNKTIAALTINHSGTTTFTDTLSCTTYTQTSGTVDFATFNLACSSTATYTAGTLNNIGTLSCTTWTCAGTFTLTQGILNPTVSFVVTGGFNYNGGTLSAVATFTHTSGNVTFSKAYALTATGTYTLTAGTLTLNGFDLTTGTFSSTNANVRSIAFGTNNIILSTTTAAATNLSMANANNFTWSGTGGFTAAADITRTFTFGTNGGSSTNAPNLTLTGNGSAVQTLTSTSYFNTLDYGTTTLTQGGAILNVNSLTLSSGGTFTSLQAVMVGTGTLNGNGKTITNLTINHTGTTTLAAALTVTSTTTLTTGTLDLAGYTLTMGVLSSSNTNARSIAFGIGSIVLIGSGSTPLMTMDDATNFTYTGTPTVTTTMSVVRTISFGSTAGGSASNALNLALTSGAASPTLTSGSWFKNLDFTGALTSTPATTTVYVDTLTLATGGTYTGLTPIFTRTQTWTAQFSKQLNGIGVNVSGGTLTLDSTQTYTATSTCYVTQGTLNLGGADQTFGAVDSNNTNTRGIAFGSNNIILGHTTAGTTVVNIPDATSFTTTGTGGFTTAMSVTRTFTFGTTGGSISNAPSLALTSGASTPTITDGSWFKSLDFTGTTCTLTGIINVDTLTLATGGTYTGLTPILNRTQTWTAQFSKQLAGIGVSAGTLTLDNTQTYADGSTLYVNGGTLNLNSTDQTFSYFVSTGTGSRSITGGGSITVRFNWTVTTGSGFTGSNYTIYMASQVAKTFAGGGGSYGTLVQQTPSALSITGSNTFGGMQVNTNMAVPAYQQEYTTPGTYSWTAPIGVTSVSVVAVGGGGGGRQSGSGGGGGGGAGLGWKNNISVTPGQSYTVVVGAGGTINTNGSSSYFINSSTVAGLNGSTTTSSTGGVGGGYVGDGGGNGGSGGVGVTNSAGGAGGAGGYSGNGGNGGDRDTSTTGFNGSGGGGGGAGYGGNDSGGGGGVGIYGQGTNGVGSVTATDSTGGGGGSGGTSGTTGGSTTGFGNGGSYGGGGGSIDQSLAASSGTGGGGAVRIIWGTGRAFPSTNTANVNV